MLSFEAGRVPFLLLLLEEFLVLLEDIHVAQVGQELIDERIGLLGTTFFLSFLDLAVVSRVLRYLCKGIECTFKHLLNLLFILEALLHKDNFWIALKIFFQFKRLLWFVEGELIEHSRRDIYFGLRIKMNRTQLNIRASNQLGFNLAEFVVHPRSHLLLEQLVVVEAIASCLALQLFNVEFKDSIEGISFDLRSVPEQHFRH